MKKGLMLLVPFVMLVGCSINGLNPFGGSNDDESGVGAGFASVTFQVVEPGRGTIGIDEINIVSASFTIVDATATTYSTNWSAGSTNIYRFDAVTPGLATLTLQDIDATAFTNTSVTNYTFRSGYNYRIWVTLGGSIYMIETNFAGAIVWRYMAVYSETHADTNVFAGNAATLYIWSPTTTISDIAVAAPEGSIYWRLRRTAGIAAWMGFGVDITNVAARDKSIYSSGHLVFSVRIANANISYKVGLKSVVTGVTNERWVSLSNIPGFAADNTWRTLSVPMSSFSGINFTGIVGAFYFSTDYPIPTTQTNVTIDALIDDVYWKRD